MNNNLFFRLPFQFDTAKLQKDLEQCHNWINHFNTTNYIGGWQVIALRSVAGKENNISAHHQEDYQNTPLLETCTYYQEIINTFQCEKQAIRLLKLDAGSSVKPHKDYTLGYEDGIFRVHIPVITNESVFFFIDEIPFQMQTGESWYVNFNHLHAVDNLGKSPRIHLVIDCVRNDWSDKVFEQSGYDFSEELTLNLPKKEDIPMMIELLEMQNTETSQKLIKELKIRLQNL